MSTQTTVRCDFCGKLLLPDGEYMPDSIKTHFESVKITYQWNGKEAAMDICPRCIKRLRKRIKREDKRNDG